MTNKQMLTEVHSFTNEINFYQELINEYKHEKNTVKDVLWYAKLDGMYEYILSSVGDRLKDLEDFLKTEKETEKENQYPF